MSQYSRFLNGAALFVASTASLGAQQRSHARRNCVCSTAAWKRPPPREARAGVARAGVAESFGFTWPISLLFRLKAKSASPSSAKGLNAASPAAQTTASAATSSRTTEEPSAQRSGSGAGPKETVTWRAVVERMAGERRHSGRQVSASTPSASPRSGQGRSRTFQLRPASSDRKRPRLLAA
jgi:hypothetical protein